MQLRGLLSDQHFLLTLFLKECYIAVLVDSQWAPDTGIYFGICAAESGAEQDDTE